MVPNSLLCICNRTTLAHVCNISACIINTMSHHSVPIQANEISISRYMHVYVYVNLKGISITF